MSKLYSFIALHVAAAIVVMSAAICPSESVTSDGVGQEMHEIRIQVVDPQGQPVEGAEVIPWALRCSQGHGMWSLNGLARSTPPVLRTDAGGKAVVPYPRYAIVDELILTTEVTLSVDHPSYTYIDYEDINVPVDSDSEHMITVQPGAIVELVLMEDGRPAASDNVYALWSDGRSWKSNASLSETEEGVLTIPVMPAGTAEVFLARFDGDRVTHFSGIVKLELEANKTMRTHVELQPAVRIIGAISDNVPRPVRNGRISFWLLQQEANSEGIDWFSWTRIAEDGTFVIESWPANESIQIIGLCDGYIAKSGDPPTDVEIPKRPSAFQRPQVFSPEQQGDSILLQMEAMVPCTIEAVDENGAPLAGIEVSAGPNVHWWNSGTQLYCGRLVRGECLLTQRDYMACRDDDFPFPFATTTNESGYAHLALPKGQQSLIARHDEYELPIVRGSRRQDFTIVEHDPPKLRFVLQAKGTEHLGEWDKLAGILFGCTGEECRRLLANPDFRSRMEKVRDLLDSAKDPSDPSILNVAYKATAEAFDEVGDSEEAVKWRSKAAEQAAKQKQDTRDEN